MFYLILTTKTFYLFLTTKTFYSLLTTKTFYSLLTTKTFYFSKTTAATYVCTHFQRSKPACHPHSCTYTEHTLARVSHSASQPPNSQMPGVGARASGIRTLADKSNAIVILDKMEYEMKMNNLLDDTITYNKLTNDPTKAVIAHFDKTVKRVLKNHPNSIKRFVTVSPSLPYIYME